MARGDYASRNKRPASRKNKAGGVPGWIWMLAGLSVGLAVAAFIYISRPPAQPLRATSAGVEADAAAARSARAAGGGIAVPPREKPRFTFYELLPSQEVLVPTQEPPKPGVKPKTQPAAPAPVPGLPDTAAPPPGRPAAPAAPNGLFVIQVASYRSQADAEEQKAGLALLGIEARVEKVTIDNRDTYYRVRIGPERDEKRARATLAQLESNGITGLLVKLK